MNSIGAKKCQRRQDLDGTELNAVVLMPVKVFLFVAVIGCEPPWKPQTTVRQLQLHETPEANDPLLAELAQAQMKLFEALNDGDKRVIDEFIVPDFRLADLRSRRVRAATMLSPGPQYAGYFEIMKSDFHLNLAPPIAAAPQRRVAQSDNGVTLEWSHHGGDLSLVTWRQTASGWKVSYIVVSRRQDALRR